MHAESTPRPRSSISGPARDLAHLLWPRWRGLANLHRREGRKAVTRLVLFGLVGLGFMAVSFLGARWLFMKFLAVEFLTELLIRRVVGMVMLFFAGLLVFSNALNGFTSFFLGRDLPGLAAAPVPTGRLYLSRLVDCWTSGSWMMLVFALPILAGCGPVLNAPWTFYVALPLVMLPLTILCAVAGSFVTLALGRLFPAQRTHDALVLLAVVGFLLLYLAFRLAEPERFLQPDGFEDLVALIGGLRAAGNPVSPTEWVTELVFALARGELMAAWRPTALLAVGSLAALSAGVWFARWLYPGALSLAMEGGGDARGLLRRLGHRGARAPKIPTSPRSALIRRDTRVFFRTTGQWSQLLLIGALIVVYVFNFKHFRTLQEMHILGPLGLFFVNIALGGLVATTLAARFLYPAVSLEGRAWWRIQVAPISLASYLRAKVAWGLWPLLVVQLSLTLAGNLIVSLPIELNVASLVVSALIAYGLAGMGVGFGALQPRFDEDNPARVASGVGGVVFMLAGLAFLVAIAALVASPVSAMRFALNSEWRPGGWTLARHVGLLLAALAVTLAAHHGSLRVAARALAQADKESR